MACAFCNEKLPFDCAHFPSIIYAQCWDCYLAELPKRRKVLCKVFGCRLIRTPVTYGGYAHVFIHCDRCHCGHFGPMA